MPAEEAIVLVGGLGTRLRDVVRDVPKPLAPVAGRPFLAWVLDRLADNGLRRVILATGYMAGTVERTVGRRWGAMEIDYSVEDSPLGTGGAVRRACERLRGDGVHVLNGDTYLAYRTDALEATTRDAGAAVGIALARVDDVARYGAVECDGARVLGFREKGRSGPGFINAGCYFLTGEAIGALPAGPVFSFETEVLTPMAETGRVAGWTRTEGFIDIGVPEDYLRAQSLFGTSR